MTTNEKMYINGGLDILEEAVHTLKGAERRALCELMQKLLDLTGVQVNLEAQREALRQFHGRAWTKPKAESLARSVGNQ